MRAATRWRCGLSGFKQHFARGQGFTYDLDDIGRYYRDYVALMAHFDAVAAGPRPPRRSTRRMVADTEARCARLLDYCGLPFEPAACASTRTDRAGAHRQLGAGAPADLPRRRATQWRSLEPWLGPLRDGARAGAARRRLTPKCQTLRRRNAAGADAPLLDTNAVTRNRTLRLRLMRTDRCAHAHGATVGRCCSARSAAAGLPRRGAGARRRAPAERRRDRRHRAEARRKTCRTCRSASRRSARKKLEQLNVTNFNDYREVPAERLLPDHRSPARPTSISAASPAAATATIRARCRASASISTSSRSRRSAARSTSTSTTSRAIEALAGPQGTLYGASSEAGTIRIITNKPDIGKLRRRLSTSRSTPSRTAASAARSKASSTCRSPTTSRCAWSAGTRTNAGYIDNVPGTRTFLPDATGIVDHQEQRRVRQEQLQRRRHLRRPRRAQDRPRRQLDDRADRDRPERRSTTAFSASTRALGDLQGPAFLARILPRPLRPGGADGPGQDRQFRPDLCRRRISTAASTARPTIPIMPSIYDSLYAGAGGIAQYFYFHDNAGKHDRPVAAHRRRRPLHQAEPGAAHRVAGRATASASSAGCSTSARPTRSIRTIRSPGLADNLSVNGHPGTLWLTQQDRVDRDYAVFGEASYDIAADRDADRRRARASSTTIS